MKLPEKLKNVKLLLAGAIMLQATPLVVFIVFGISMYHCDINNCELGVLPYYFSTFLFAALWVMVGLIILIAGIIRYFIDRRK